MKEKVLIDQSDIFVFIDNSNLDKEIATLGTKAALKTKQNKVMKP